MLVFEKREWGHSELVGGLEQVNDREVFTEKRREGCIQETFKRKKQDFFIPAINSAS